MALSGAERSKQIYNAIAAANPTLNDTNKVTEAERNQVRAQINAMFGADTTYLAANTVVRPWSMTTAQGATVQVAYPAGTGTVTSTAPVATGTGTIS